MRKTSKDGLFYIFAFLLFFFIIAFVNYWNNNMTEVANDTSDKRWLVYSVYLLTAYSLYIWSSNIGSKIGGIHLICLLWCVIMPFVIWFNHGNLFDILQTILWPLLFESSYWLVKQDKQKLGAFRKFFVVASIYGAYFFLESRVNMFMHEKTQSNTIYFVFLTLPWLLLAKGKTTRLMLLVLFTIIGVWSLKRSVMLTLVFIWSAYFISLIKNKGRSGLNLFLIVILIVGGIYGYSYGDQLFKGELSERINREETDEGRNRLGIYTVTWSMIQSSSSESLVLGHGHFGVRRDSILEISAHNDFLEVLYDYGIIVLLLYLTLWVYVVWKCISLYRSNSVMFLPYAVSLSIFLVMSMVSHLILYTSYFNYLVLFWGSVEGICFSKNKLKR